MCQGIPLLVNNKKVLYGKKTNSHSTTADDLGVNEDQYRKFEYLWWEKKLQQVHYDRVAEDILKEVDTKKATKLAQEFIKKNFNTQDKLAKWLKNVPNEWDKLMQPEFKNLARKVNPKLVFYADKIEQFKKTPIEKYNPYQATKLPTLKKIKSSMPDQVRNQVWDQVWNQVWDQVWDQVGDQVGDQVRDQVRNQVGYQVWDQVGNQVGDQVWDQVGDQVWATSYWAINVSLSLGLHHWFFDFLKLGIMVIFVKGKVKVFGKKGKFLGEYNAVDFK